ncbi:MAG: hypothetical protein J7598_16890 [Mitsuaria chitosanitabida]|uniref:hypothetical protein n=1 Tax=Roseateles chitosanitabidus TaxID=65048 RepID=UPI001B18C0D4|nr:hypothetical protein [Roseateles chitosanitabidus]MBO9688281.1 hypothetical protein [Roseateles chitosanitabidus]
MSGESNGMRPIRVVAEGLCSALGHTLPRTSAAIRSRLNLFRETRFVGLGGKPVVGAPVDGFNVWGGQRQAALARLAFEEAWARARSQEGEQVLPATTALLLLLPPVSQPATPLRELHEVFQGLSTGYGLHRASRAMHAGKGGLADGVQMASRWLDQGGDGEEPIRHVLMLASDSLLTAPTIDRLLAQHRLAEERHTDALIPGEAAAAVMLTRLAPPSSAAEVWITGAASGQDDWRLDGDEPIRAQALTATLREAARQSGIAVADSEFHASGMNGEHWMGREIELAMSRAMERKREQFPHHRIAQFIGDAGTAGAVATLGWISHEMRTNAETGRAGTIRVGRTGLLHFADDDGRRSALILRSRAPAQDTA